MLNVPFVKQNTHYTCASAVLEMVFEFYGKKVTEEELNEFLKVEEDAQTENHELGDAAEHYGFFKYINYDTTIDEIKHFIDMGIPVIVNYLEPEGDDGHYAVVTDIDEKTITLNDPTHGAGFIMSLMEFAARWRSKYSPYKEWLLVISDKELLGVESRAPKVSI